jgi:negative regulator of replication initiation
MATTIRITTEMEQHIAHHGKFGETHDDVLRRIIPDFAKFFSKEEAQEAQEIQEIQEADADFISQEAFRVPLLKVLLSAPGYRLRCNEVVKKVGETMPLKSSDYKTFSNGRFRWEHNIHWVRNKLKDNKVIEPTKISKRGFWQLTPKGVVYAKKAVNSPH